MIPFIKINPITVLELFRPYAVRDLKRLGNKYDGGYIVHYPSLKDADYLINYGVGYNVKFEKDFFKETAKPTLAFDPTLKDIKPIIANLFRGEFVPFLRHLKKFCLWPFQERNLNKYKIQFIKEGISNKDSKQYKTFRYHFDKYNLSGKKIIFKLDVEGAEYPVFNDKSIYPYLANAIQIYIEFHDLSQNLEKIADIISNLKETHSLVHIHANNHARIFEYNGKKVPDAIEVTFLQNTYLPVKNPSTTSYPIAGLDQPCDRLKEDIALNFFY